jgi:hypothetical protein
MEMTSLDLDRILCRYCLLFLGTALAASVYAVGQAKGWW